MDTTQAKIVVAGHISPHCISVDVAPDFGTYDEWREIMSVAIDATPESMTVEELAQRDARNDSYHPPVSCALADYDKYVQVWFAERERMAQEAADTQDYEDYLEDVAWWRMGQW